MKRKAFDELKGKPVVEMEKEIYSLKERLRSLKFDLAAGKVKNAKEVKNVKKSIAQLMTVVNGSKQNEKTNT